MDHFTFPGLTLHPYTMNEANDETHNR